MSTGICSTEGRESNTYRHNLIAGRLVSEMDCGCRLSKALVNLKMPEKRFWHSDKTKLERLSCFRVYLSSLSMLQLHSMDMRSVLINWLQLSV